MSTTSLPDYADEVERYELSAEPRYQFEPDRREFLQRVGGGIIVALILTDAVAAEAVSSVGRVGLAFVHAVAVASSASALQIAKYFSFMCSYSGLEILSNVKTFRDKGWETRRRL